MSGKYSQKGKKKAFPWLAVVIVLAVLAIAAVALVFLMPGFRDDADDPTAPDTQAAETEPAVTAEPVLTEPTQPESTEPTEPVVSTESMLPPETVTELQVNTPYCTLHYPAKWNGSVKLVTDEQPEKFIVTFIGLIGEHEAELFAVVFGESTEMPIGALVLDDGTTVAVRLNVDLFAADDSWSDEEIALAYEMIADSTFVLEKLSELENFQ